MPDQSCGTCKWWDVENAQRSVVVDDTYALCNFPIPDSAVGGKFMYSRRGTTCPCYQRRATEVGDG